jgi:tetratricopeptide (TPR) repeat protein
VIDAISSLLQPTLVTIGSGATSSPSTSESLFGPDFILAALNSQQVMLGAAYDSSGQSLLPPADSTAGQARTAILNKAGYLFKAGDYAAARTEAQRLVAKYRSDATPVYLIGRSFLMEGDYGQAETYLARAASLAPDSEEVQQDLDAAKTLSRGETAATERVQQLLRNRATASQGLQLGAHVLRAWPKNLTTRLAVAEYYREIGRVDYAGAAYAEALKQVPAEKQGSLLKQLEEFAAAHSDDPAAHDLLAQAYGNAGRLADAEREFERALELSEDDVVFQSGVKADFADVYARMGHAALTAGDQAGALQHLEKAQKLNWTDDRKIELADLETRAGEKALQAGLTGKALSALGKAASYLPAEDEDRRDRLITDYERLAARLTASGDLRRAVTARRGAYDLDDANDARKRRLADAHDAYGLWLFGQGRYREAVRTFKAALKLYPDDDTYSAHLDDAEDAS